MSDNYLLQFLESTSNIRATFANVHGWSPSELIASDIAACLRQGRLFYQAARDAPQEIKPLQMHYGMVAYAKALILWARRTSLSTLKHGHGVKDTTENGRPLSRNQVRVESSGTFPLFNDVVAARNRISLYEGVRSFDVALPASGSAAVAGMTFRLDELLSRIPMLRDSIPRTFGRPSATLPFQLTEYGGDWHLRIDTTSRVDNIGDLRGVIAEWRRDYPFMMHWHFNESNVTYGSTAITFAAANYRATELDDIEVLVHPHGVRSTVLSGLPVEEHRLETRLPPVAGSLGIRAAAVLPIGDVVLSEYSVQFLVLHSLSSLVRYRPQVWMKALAGSRDDHMLALIGEFLLINQAVVPELIASELFPESGR